MRSVFSTVLVVFILMSSISLALERVPPCCKEGVSCPMHKPAVVTYSCHGSGKEPIDSSRGSYMKSCQPYEYLVLISPTYLLPSSVTIDVQEYAKSMTIEPGTIRSEDPPPIPDQPPRY